MRTRQLCKKIELHFLQVSPLHMHRSQIFFLPLMQCRMLRMWLMSHYVLCYSSPRPRSIFSLREQRYLIDVLTFFTAFKTEASLVSIPSSLRTTAVWPPLISLLFSFQRESHSPNHSFLFPPNLSCLSLFYTFHSLSPFSSPTQFVISCTYPP